MKNKFIFLIIFIISFFGVFLCCVNLFYVYKFLFVIQSSTEINDINWKINSKILVSFIKPSILGAIGIILIVWIYYKYDV